MTVAASQDYKFTNNVLKFKFEHGDNVPADVYGSAIEYSMQFKPENAVKEFEQDAYEYRKKVENGEIDAPWMTSEHFIAQSTAIGVGITSNKNLSTRAKAELLNTWDRHASEFGDYYDIKGAYNKIVEQKSSENGNFAQGVINVKKIMLEDFYNDIEHFPRAWKKRQKHVSVELKQKADSTTLKSELKTKSISEIKNEYSNSISEIARIVLSNDVEYKNRIDDILDYLKAYSGKDIGLMTVGCTTPTISKIIQAFPDKADDILDVVAPTMCYAGKKAVERINNEGNNNAAA